MRSDVNFTLKYFLKQVANGVFFSFFFTLILLVFMSGVIFFTSFSFSETLIQYMLLAIHFFSIVLGSFLVGRWLKGRGLLLGSCIGLFYTLFAALLGLTCSEGALGVIALLNHVLLGVFAGALGGILGVNLSEG